MPSNDDQSVASGVLEGTASSSTGPAEPKPFRPKLSRKQRRKRIILLVVLLILLALLSYATYFFIQNRRAPSLKFATGEAAIAPPQYLYSITGSGGNELDRPVGVAVGPDGRVYVVDFGKRRVSVFSNSGKYLSSFSKTDTGVLHNPVNLAIRGDEIWVSDRRDRTLYIFDLNGTFKRRFEPKNEPKYDWGPLAITFAADGALRATDLAATALHRVQFFSAEGSRTATVGKTAQANSPKETPLGFFFPSGIAVAKDGRVMVSDGNNRRIQVLSPTGEFKYFIDTSGIPRGTAIDEKQRLFVVDAAAHSVDVYSLDGKRLTQFGTKGFGPGQFNYPNDVALDTGNKIYVTDRENDQVQVWGWPVAQVPALRAPTTPWGWALCLLPLLLLLVPLAFRRVHILVSPEFVERLVEADAITLIAEHRRLRLSCPESDHELYEGRTVDGVDLGELIRGEVFSESEARAVRERLECTELQSVVLSMAERSKALGTDDDELRRLARLLEVPIMTSQQFLDTYVRNRH